VLEGVVIERVGVDADDVITLIDDINGAFEITIGASFGHSGGGEVALKDVGGVGAVQW
jgi:hypothetical protein